MSMDSLLFALGFSVAGYLFYRYLFLKNPKKELPHKPHFTLKIEPE